MLNNNLGYGEGGAPLLLQNIEANATIAVNIRVKDLCPERNLNGRKKMIKEEKKNDS